MFHTFFVLCFWGAAFSSCVFSLFPFVLVCFKHAVLPSCPRLYVKAICCISSVVWFLHLFSSLLWSFNITNSQQYETATAADSIVPHRSSHSDANCSFLWSLWEMNRFWTILFLSAVLIVFIRIVIVCWCYCCHHSLCCESLLLRLFLCLWLYFIVLCFCFICRFSLYTYFAYILIYCIM